MKKIQVNHTPNFIKQVAIASVFLWIIFTFFVCYIIPKSSLLLSLGLLLFIIGIAFYMDSRKTTVEYDTEKLNWKWLWINYTVNFKNLNSVHYTIVSERMRYGCFRYFELVFKIKDYEFKLNDKLKTEDIENSINGSSDNIKLMELYRFIENIYPEKSKGFVKTGD